MERFKRLLDKSEYLQLVLTKIRANIYVIEEKELKEITKILSNVKFDIK